MTVLKRDGEKEELDSKKIYNSIVKANDNVKSDERLTNKQLKRITESVVAMCETLEETPIDIDVLEDIIEKKLMEASGYEVAKKYITYRYEKERVRMNKSLTEKLTASNVQNQNANVDEFSFGGRVGETASYVTKQYALDHLVSKKTLHNHNNNEVYIHDLDAYAVGSHNCAERNMWVEIKDGNEPKLMKIGDVADKIGVGYNQIADTSKSNIYILSRDGWTKLLNITKRKLNEGELLYTFKTRNGLPLKVTESHRLPIIRDGKEIVVEAKDIKVGDSLLDIDNVKLSSDDINDMFLDLTKIDDEDVDIRIVNTSPLRHYLRYKYDVVFTDYVKNNGFSILSDGRVNSRLKLSEFNKLCNDYPLSMDVLSKLQIKSNGSKHSYPLCIPFSSDLAKLYGYIYGDGGVYIRKDSSLYQLTFTNTDQRLMDDFVRCYENVFGYKLNISYPNNENNSPCMRVTDGSLIACKIFKDFAGAKKNGSSDIRIPDFIMNGTEDIKYGFLSAAIDTDGSVGDHSIVYTTCSDVYSDQIVLLLEGLGYHPSKTMNNAKGTEYKIHDNVGKRNFDIYTIYLWRNDEICKLLEKMGSFKQSDKIAYKGLTNKFNENKIYSIKTESGDYDVFDVETSSHWFIVNNYVSHNCLSIPFDKLLANGFNTRQGDVRPAGSINTAFQLVAVIFQLQSLQQFGGVSATHLDWTMVPYVRKSFWKHFKDGMKYIDNTSDERIAQLFEKVDTTKISITKSDTISALADDARVFDYAFDKTEKELEQAVEGMYHNLNTLQSRSGNQLPFTSINYGTCTLPEGRMVTKALLEGSINGIGKFHKTSIFPCGIFQCMKGVNRKPGEPNYDLFQLACKSTALRLYPNYANCDWNNNASAIQYDREVKQKVIDSLSEDDYNKLIERLEENPELKSLLMLDVIEE